LWASESFFNKLLGPLTLGFSPALYYDCCVDGGQYFPLISSGGDEIDIFTVNRGSFPVGYHSYAAAGIYACMSNACGDAYPLFAGRTGAWLRTEMGTAQVTAVTLTEGDSSLACLVLDLACMIPMVIGVRRAQWKRSHIGNRVEEIAVRE
jgi:hypothetical protein